MRKKIANRKETVYLWPARGGERVTCPACGTPCLIIRSLGNDVLLDSTTKDIVGKGDQGLPFANVHTQKRCREALRSKR